MGNRWYLTSLLCRRRHRHSIVIDNVSIWECTCTFHSFFSSCIGMHQLLAGSLMHDDDVQSSRKTEPIENKRQRHRVRVMSTENDRIPFKKKKYISSFIHLLWVLKSCCIENCNPIQEKKGIWMKLSDVNEHPLIICSEFMQKYFFILGWILDTSLTLMTLVHCFIVKVEWNFRNVQWIVRRPASQFYTQIFVCLKCKSNEFHFSLFCNWIHRTLLCIKRF